VRVAIGVDSHKHSDESPCEVLRACEEVQLVTVVAVSRQRREERDGPECRDQEDRAEGKPGQAPIVRHGTQRTIEQRRSPPSNQGRDRTEHSAGHRSLDSGFARHG
jgi:hypothetical protein